MHANKVKMISFKFILSRCHMQYNIWGKFTFNILTSLSIMSRRSMNGSNEDYSTIKYVKFNDESDSDWKICLAKNFKRKQMGCQISKVIAVMVNWH